VPLSRDEKIDWFRVIVDIERHGYTHANIALVIDVPRRTIGSWKIGASPRYEDGLRLLELWASVTKNRREIAPSVNRYSYQS
jgi:hypothetical protein